MLELRRKVTQSTGIFFWPMFERFWNKKWWSEYIIEQFEPKKVKIEDVSLYYMNWEAEWLKKHWNGYLKIGISIIHLTKPNSDEY